MNDETNIIQKRASSKSATPVRGQSQNTKAAILSQKQVKHEPDDDDDEFPIRRKVVRQSAVIDESDDEKEEDKRMSTRLGKKRQIEEVENLDDQPKSRLKRAKIIDESEEELHHSQKAAQPSKLKQGDTQVKGKSQVDAYIESVKYVPSAKKQHQSSGVTPYMDKMSIEDRSPNKNLKKEPSRQSQKSSITVQRKPSA